MGVVLATGETASARTCADLEGRVLTLTPSARIVSVRGDGFRVWYGCVEGRARRVELDVQEAQTQLYRPMLAGSFAAFERYQPSTITRGPEAVVVDLAARRRAEMGVEGSITGMVLSQRGDLVVTNEDSVLHLRRGRGVATLDMGDITPGSLALSRNGRFVYWQNAGQARVLRLPRGAPVRRLRRVVGSCSARKGRMVAVGPRSRITAERVAGTLAWYACLNRGGRRVWLGIQDSPEEEMRLPTLAGTYVAWELSELSIAPGPEAMVRDLASDKEAGITVEGGITGLVLSSRGDLIATSPYAVEYAKPGRALATLDNGDIARRSLALSRNGRYAYWVNAGQPRVHELTL